MSLVNKMLQELDRRHATEPVETTPESILGQRVRPTRQALVGSEWFWRVLAVLIIAALGWVAWVGWQLMPRTSVTELALKSAVGPRPAVQAGARASPVPGPGAVPPENVSSPPASVVTAQVPSANAAQGQSTRAEMMLAREISTPIKDRPARPAPGAQSVDKQSLAALKPTTASAVEPRAKLVAKPSNAPAQNGAATSLSGQIDKRDTNTPREYAEGEYRRAVNFVNQGRMAEGMEALRAALTVDPAYETARQTQVSLLLDAKRMDEAARSLEDGLALNPSHIGFAMLLARIMVERNDLVGGLALLQKHAIAAANNAEYHGFVAALYQRMGRHKEASDEYQRALRIGPQNGAWWVGLGISLESQQRSKEAGDAFRRARSAGALSPELAGYVEQRLKALP